MEDISLYFEKGNKKSLKLFQFKGIQDIRHNENLNNKTAIFVKWSAK